MKKLVEYISSSLVDDKEAVRVEETTVDRKSQYSLSVSPQDLGKVIGKKGRTVKAVRVLISAFASLQGRQVGLQVLEPEKSSDVQDAEENSSEEMDSSDADSEIIAAS